MIKVSQLKKNPKQSPQPFINIGVSGIMDVCKRRIFASNATPNFIVQEGVRQERPSSVLDIARINSLRMKLENGNRRLGSALNRGTRESGLAGLKLFDLITALRDRIAQEQTPRVGVVGCQQKMSWLANQSSIVNGGVRSLTEMTGRVKNADSGAGVCTLTTLNHLRITKNSVSTCPMVGRFANPVISKPTPTGVRL